jgi:DNA-binding transcriptional LysR family regulator
MEAADRILRRLKLRELRTLLTVMEQGSLVKAAQSLSVSRPVVSRTIADLERTLGVRLLDRSPLGIEPTLFGRALLKRSVAVFDELRQSMKELAFLADPNAGELRVGCSEYMAAGIVPAAVERLTRQRPQMRFQVDLGDPVSLGLRERKVEFVIGRLLAPAVDPDMAAETLFREQAFIAAGPDNKWAKRGKVRLAELVDEPWMLAPPEIVAGSPVVEAFRAQKLPIPEATVLGYSLPMRNGLLATGRFLTMVPGSVLRLGAERFMLKPLAVDLPRWRLPVAIVTLRNRTLSPVAQLFLDSVRAIAKPLAERG